MHVWASTTSSSFSHALAFVRRATEILLFACLFACQCYHRYRILVDADCYFGVDDDVELARRVMTNLEQYGVDESQWKCGQNKVSCCRLDQ